uniref:CPBP family intramembrane metalloprotease n=1 Tax=candidate division WOR-3 bacterium TaxID=2052148 RepID=A0A7V1EH72_UNCW3
MKKWLSEIIVEIRKIDLEILVIVCYSTFVLLFSLYLKRTRIFFPNEPFFEKLVLLGIIYAISPFIPMFLFKNKPADYGLKFGEYKIWLNDLTIIFSVMLIVLLIVFKFTNLKTIYPLSYTARKGFNNFVMYQIIQLFHMFSWEFFFRGFMLFGLAKKMDNKLAILIQMIPFALMHYRKPPLEAYGSIFAGIFLGIIAIRARSFLPSAILHFLVALSADIIGMMF